MSYICYLRKGIVYLPNMKKTEAGFHIGVEPVLMINVNKMEELSRAIHETLSKSIPIVPTPPRDAKLNNILEVTKLRSWSAFEKDAVRWVISEHQSTWKIAIQRSRKDGGGDDKENLIVFPPGTTVDEVSERLFQVVLEKARERGEV
ncbi:MAG TPA: hypothetical protein VGV37_13610 [Aliidongia sp.]|uniref:hypothetical protein n=1 Tax=Aliidongia sp. TaxID=1914230 RepID=UPI002DDD7620|nr:hypothetical protein [Aliidongia sp.]HEV2675575.1 hypothetical protein [Aliidongia sp.]